jgi:inosine-uridine nucleoside N-ribohydrolase
MFCVVSILPSHAQRGLLPYDSSNHVWYDNDFAVDYIDWYLMVVASAGNLKLRGIATTTSETQYFDDIVAQRARVIANGRSSGFRNIPDPLPGAPHALVPPASGVIGATEPVVSAGIVGLVAAAHRAFTETGKPLVVVAGGPLTAVASAYLRDPTIASKVIVAFIDNYDSYIGGYNGQSDPWAAYIVLERLALVYFPAYPGDVTGPFPRLSKTWIANNLPPSAAREHMLALELDVINEPDGDADGMTAVSVVANNYVRAVKRVSFGGWLDVGTDGVPRRVPIFRDDRNGRALVVTQADEATATSEYQRAFLNPSIWRRVAVPRP